MQHTPPLPVLPKFEQSATSEDDGPKEMKELEEEGLSILRLERLHMLIRRRAKGTSLRSTDSHQVHQSGSHYAPTTRQVILLSSMLRR
jgi:hypothetical protein